MNEYGDPYTFVCFALRIDVDSVFISGAAGDFSKSDYTAIVKALREEGITKITWERNKKGKKIKIEKDFTA